MRKKVFAVFAVMLLMSSNLSAIPNANGQSFNYDHCEDVANIRYASAIIVGLDTNAAYEMSVNAFNSCVDDVNLRASQYWN